MTNDGGSSTNGSRHMKITVDNEKTLQIEEQNTGIILFSFVLFAFFTARLGYLIFQHESSLREYIGVIIGIVVTGGAGNAFSEKIKFQFNRYEKAIRWSRKKIIGTKESGIIPFQDIIKVNLASISQGQETKYRIELVCHNQTIPISAVYEQGNKGKYDQIIKKIVEFIKL